MGAGVLRRRQCLQGFDVSTVSDGVVFFAVSEGVCVADSK